MLAPNSHVKTLNQLGLTFCEARVYLALVSLRTCPAKTISKAVNMSKPDVYRALATLQERAFVEKIMAYPALFKARSLDESLLTLLKDKDKERNILLEKTEQMKHDFENSRMEREPQDSKEQFILIPGRDAELERRRKGIKTAQTSIDVIISWKRLPKTLFLFAEETKAALRRSVKVRFITEKSKDMSSLSEYYNDIRKIGFYKIRYVLDCLQAVVTIYDDKEVIIATSPEAGMGETAILWTSNASIVTVMREHFDVLWMKAKNYEDQISFA